MLKNLKLVSTNLGEYYESVKQILQDIQMNRDKFYKVLKSWASPEKF